MSGIRKAFCIVGALLLLANAARAESDVIAQYKGRLETVRKNLPQIAACAERVAERWVKHEKMYVHVSSGGDNDNFTMEMMSRAGGLGVIVDIGAHERKGQS